MSRAKTDQRQIEYRNAIVVQCYSSDEYDNAGFDVAVLEITPGLVRRVKQWRELFRKLHEEHSDLITVDFDDCTPDFFHLDETGDLEDLVLTEEFELQSFIRCATLVVPHSRWQQDFYGCWVEVGQFGLHWTVLPKVGRMQIDTYELDISTLG